MSLRYHIVKKRDPRRGVPHGLQLYYGQVRSESKVTSQEICEQVAALTSGYEGDVEGVLEGLIFLMRQHLANGDTVDLKDLGRFRVTMGSPGVEKKEDFKPSMFRKGRIVFAPCVRMKQLCDRVHFEKSNLLYVVKEK